MYNSSIALCGGGVHCVHCVPCVQSVELTGGGEVESEVYNSTSVQDGGGLHFTSLHCAHCFLVHNVHSVCRVLS